MHSTGNPRNPEDSAIGITKSQPSQRFWRPDKQPLGVDLNSLRNEHPLASTEALRAAPLAWQAAKRNLAPMQPAQRYTLYGNQPGPPADSRLEASSSSTISETADQITSRGACCIKHTIIWAWSFGILLLRAPKMLPPMLAQPVWSLIRVEKSGRPPCQKLH